MNLIQKLVQQYLPSESSSIDVAALSSDDNFDFLERYLDAGSRMPELKRESSDFSEVSERSFDRLVGESFFLSFLIKDLKMKERTIVDVGAGAWLSPGLAAAKFLGFSYSAFEQIKKKAELGHSLCVDLLGKDSDFEIHQREFKPSTEIKNGLLVGRASIKIAELKKLKAPFFWLISKKQAIELIASVTSSPLIVFTPKKEFFNEAIKNRAERNAPEVVILSNVSRKMTEKLKLFHVEQGKAAKIVPRGTIS